MIARERKRKRKRIARVIIVKINIIHSQLFPFNNINLNQMIILLAGKVNASASLTSASSPTDTNSLTH